VGLPAAHFSDLALFVRGGLRERSIVKQISETYDSHVLGGNRRIVCLSLVPYLTVLSITTRSCGIAACYRARIPVEDRREFVVSVRSSLSNAALYANYYNRRAFGLAAERRMTFFSSRRSPQQKAYMSRIASGNKTGYPGTSIRPALCKREMLAPRPVERR